MPIADLFPGLFAQKSDRDLFAVAKTDDVALLRK